MMVFAVALHPTAANQKNTAIMGYQWAQDKFQELMEVKCDKSKKIQLSRLDGDRVLF